MKIYNHDIRTAGPARLKLGKMYATRALCITGPGDVIQLPIEAKAHWDDIQSHYARVGLEHTDNVVWDLRLERTLDYPDAELSPFFFGDRENQFRPDEARRRITSLLNSKNQFIELARTHKVTVPKTKCFDSSEAFLGGTHDDIDYPVFFKPAVSTSGLGIVYCRDENSLREAVTKFDKGVAFQVQQEVVADGFVSFQYECVDGRATHLLISDLLAANNAHIGNATPSKHAGATFLDGFAQYAVDQGLKGVFGFDVAASRTGPAGSLFALECNPRFNASTYPAVTARRLGIANWRSEIIKTRHRRLKDLNLADLEFNRASGCGIVVVGWGTIDYGRIMIQALGSPQQQAEFLAEVKRRAA